MKIKYSIVSFILLLLFFSSHQTSAQDTDSSWSHNWDKEAYKDHGWDWDSDWDWQFSFSGFEHPTINLSYGLSKYSLKDLVTPVSDNGLGELRLGYTKEKKTFRSDYIIKHQFNYASLSNLSYKLGLEEKANEINAEMWRFGFGWEDGYGYKFGNSSVILYNTWGMNWSKITVDDTIINLADREMINLFKDDFHFGTLSAGGIKIRPVPLIEVEAGVERSAIYSRVLFWKAAGSLLIEAAGQGLVDSFVRNVLSSTPAAAPVVSFLLKNGLSFAMYELRKEKMNWPFDSASPVMVDTYRVGVTFIF